MLCTVKLSQRAILPCRTGESMGKVSPVEFTAGFILSRIVAEIERWTRSAFPMGKISLVIGIIEMLLLDRPIRSAADKAPCAFRVGYAWQIAVFGVDVQCAEYSDQELASVGLLHDLVILTITHIPPAPAGLHREVPTAGGANPFFIMPCTVDGDLLSTGCTKSSYALCPLLVVIEEISRKNIPVRPPFQAAWYGRNALHSRDDPALTGMLPFLFPTSLDLMLQVPQCCEAAGFFALAKSDHPLDVFHRVECTTVGKIVVMA